MSAVPPAQPTSAEIRGRMVDALQLDLVGPFDERYADEVLREVPSRWYLTGFLVPVAAPPGDRADADVDDGLDGPAKPTAADDDPIPEGEAARGTAFPSSLGLSFLVPATVDSVEVTARWGDYTRHQEKSEEESKKGPVRWARSPREESVRVVLPRTGRTKPIELADSRGLELVASIRPVKASTLLPAGTRSVSLFLVNRRDPAPDVKRDEAYAFQPELRIRSIAPFVARPDVRGLESDDWDERVADLQYRDTFEWAVGHNVSAASTLDPDGHCREIRTAWIPVAEVEKVEPGKVDRVELGMRALADTEDAAALIGMLTPLVEAYGAWLDAQEQSRPSEGHRGETAAVLIERARIARGRIAAGIALLAQDDVRKAFRLANRAMEQAARMRATHGHPDRKPENVEAPKWRPFQLAFLLMNLDGLAGPTHPDRELVDLLFFPTGGGKTEAYLGLAAFTLVLRRLRNPGLSSAGVTVLMRYTLRLLTLDQLSRASGLICALELERRADVTLGTWPFEIGLWVGQAATPNKMGRKGDGDENAARMRTERHKRDEQRHPSPVPLQDCPWCGHKLRPNSFQLVPDVDHPRDLRIVCLNRACAFKGDNPLPILAVDEPIYRRLPCFLIATVDKFASLPWEGRTGALFGKVERYDKAGFYGPCDPHEGAPLAAPLLPPDLVIQDELHLISGPLGTMVGLYETAIDALSTRMIDGVSSRPKIVASTATVRRAERQIRGLFGRRDVEIFPPPGADRRDSYFAKTVPVTQKSARRYVGIAAPGRSLKVVLLRTYLALLSAAERAWEDCGGIKNPDNPADPYMTVLGYFNSLRELGGSRRIVEDEVKHRLLSYGRRRREGESGGLFANREIAYEPSELTSRVSTGKVAETKRRLGLSHHSKEHVDVALATNMISVGLDITRLGLMVVLGQPKTAAEYIQATSRVGRNDERPGLVVTLLNVHKPRDRSHYERFTAWHGSFYRAVEATSVTPFSPRAIDRGLAAVLVGLSRQGHPGMTAPIRADAIGKHRQALDGFADALARRAEGHDLTLTTAEQEELRQKIKQRSLQLLDAWQTVANENLHVGAGLQYQREVGGPPRLLFDPLDHELAKQTPAGRRFKAQRSLRDVEPSVNLWIKTPDGNEIREEEES